MSYTALSSTKSATSATRVCSFSNCPYLSHVAPCSWLLQRQWHAIRGLLACAIGILQTVSWWKNGKTVLGLVCGGSSQQESSSVFLSMEHNGFSLPMKPYSGWQTEPSATWELFPQFPIPCQSYTRPSLEIWADIRMIVTEKRKSIIKQANCKKKKVDLRTWRFYLSFFFNHCLYLNAIKCNFLGIHITKNKIHPSMINGL